jgi:hypothetical protein
MLKHTAKIKTTATPYLKGRSLPSLSGEHIKNLQPGSSVSGQDAFVSADGYVWMNITSTSPTCWAATSFMTEIVTIDDTEEEEPIPTPVEFPPFILVRIEEGGEEKRYNVEA